MIILYKKVNINNLLTILYYIRFLLKEIRNSINNQKSITNCFLPFNFDLYNYTHHLNFPINNMNSNF